MIIKIDDNYEEKVDYLYCGRTKYCDLVYPTRGKDRNLNNNLYGIYATQYKEIAASHAITFDINGFVDFNKYGFVYILNPEDFIQLNSWEFISYDPVKPITFELIKPIKYLHYILNGEWQGVTSYGTKGFTDKFNSSKFIKTEECDYLADEFDNPKDIAKGILHNEILEVINKYESGELDSVILYDMLKKLDKNWEEFIK